MYQNNVELMPINHRTLLSKIKAEFPKKGSTITKAVLNMFFFGGNEYNSY